MVKIDLKKTAALWGCIYLFLTIGPFMFLLLPLSLFLAVSLGVIFVITLKLWRIGQLVLTKDRVFLFVLFLLYIIHLSLPLWGHSFDWSKIFIFSPLLCIIFWEDCIYYRLFRLFRKWMIFFAFFSMSLPSEYPALKQVAPKLRIASTIPKISIWHPPPLTMYQRVTHALCEEGQTAYRYGGTYTILS